MTISSLRKKLKLTDSACENIKKTLQETEDKTTGEIVVAFTTESSTYAFYELLFALVLGFVVFGLCIAFSENIIQFLNARFWSIPEWGFALFCGVATLLSIILGYFLANIPFVDKKIIPLSEKILATEAKARSCFFNAGIYKTAENSGILIFVSFLEQRVRILADSGIATKIEQSKWDEIAKKLAVNLKSNSEKAITETICECGEILATNFPPHEENPNELPNELLFLEGGQW